MWRAAFTQTRSVWLATILPDEVWYADGSCLLDKKGNLCIGHAIVSQDKAIESNVIPWVKSAQAAELVAMIRACVLVEIKRVTLSTDSQYLWSVCFSTGQIWFQRGFLTSSESEVSHKKTHPYSFRVSLASSTGIHHGLQSLYYSNRCRVQRELKSWWRSKKSSPAWISPCPDGFSQKGVRIHHGLMVQIQHLHLWTSNGSTRGLSHWTSTLSQCWLQKRWTQNLTSSWWQTYSPPELPKKNSYTLLNNAKDQWWNRFWKSGSPQEFTQWQHAMWPSVIFAWSTM